jgi:DNA primase
MPLYPEGVLEEVRNSANIVSLISEYVALKKRGRNFVARCPFHTEKTPSFNVNEEKQIFMCFGCGMGGDIFKFVMQIEHRSFPEAVQLVAERYGIALPERSGATPAESGSDLRELLRVMTEASAFYQRMLLSDPEGRAALSYLEGRGVLKSTMERFALGYAPGGGDLLIQWLSQKGIPLQLIEECGLAKRSEDGSRHYDAFRGRIMFPITDVRGRVIAFGGRALGDRQPKYLNSPETKLYNKSRNLFGLSFAREGIKKQDCAVLVEGYMDFIIPFQYGIENLVASLGTSLTPHQVRLLARYAHEVVVSYDPDSAGLAATQRSLDLLLEEDFRVRVVRLPEGQDPDQFVRNEGAGAYRNRLGGAAAYLDFVLESAISSQGGIDSPRSKVQILNAVLPYLAKLPNAVERSDYVFRFARRLQIEDQQLLAEVKKAAQQKSPRLPEARVTDSAQMKFAEKRLLQLLLGRSELQREVLPLCSLQDVEGMASEKIFAVVFERFSRDEITNFEDLHRLFAGEAEQSILARLQMEEIPEAFSRETAESFINALHVVRLASYKQRILSQIAAAAEINDDATLNHLMEQRVLVDRELVSLSRK